MSYRPSDRLEKLLLFIQESYFAKMILSREKIIVLQYIDAYIIKCTVQNKFVN